MEFAEPEPEPELESESELESEPEPSIRCLEVSDRSEADSSWKRQRGEFLQSREKTGLAIPAKTNYHRETTE